jgi:hypothetical protein
MSIQSKRQREIIKAIDVTNSIFKLIEGTEGRCELDSHADTCVAGANFLAWDFTGTACEVSPFTDEYESMKDVPVVSAVTAWTNDNSGETFILLFHQVLWYGNKLSHSLLNPNQIRHFGHALCDDVTDMTRFFGIETEDVSIPFTMKGTNIFFETRVPTTWEMKNCHMIVMTDDGMGIRQRVNRDSYSDELSSISDVFSDSQLTSRLVSAVQINMIKREPLTNSLLEKRTSHHENQKSDTINNISYLIAKNRHSHVTAE